MDKLSGIGPGLVRTIGLSHILLSHTGRPVLSTAQATNNLDHKIKRQGMYICMCYRPMGLLVLRQVSSNVLSLDPC